MLYQYLFAFMQISPLFVKPTESLFTEIGSRFIEEVSKAQNHASKTYFLNKRFIMKMTLEFGTDHIYNCDVFNEVRPTQSDPEFISMVGSAVFNAMTLADPDAIWL